MSVFSDKTYENMDFLSQAVEPYVSPLNDILASFEDETKFTNQQILDFVVSSYGSFSISEALRTIKPDLESMDWHESSLLEKCFEFRVSGDIVVDVENRVVDGELFIVKKTNLVEDRDIRELMAYTVNLPHRAGEVYNAQLHELGMLLFTEDSDFFKTKSTKNKLYLLEEAIRTGAREDRFKIRSVEVFKTFVGYIRDYLTKSDDKSLGQIFRVLKMAKAGQVIYTLGA